MRRALTASESDFSIFVTSPVSLLFLIIAALWIGIPLLLKLKGKKVIINEEE